MRRQFAIVLIIGCVAAAGAGAFALLDWGERATARWQSKMVVELPIGTSLAEVETWMERNSIRPIWRESNNNDGTTKIQGRETSYRKFVLAGSGFVTFEFGFENDRLTFAKTAWLPWASE